MLATEHGNSRQKAKGSSICKLEIVVGPTFEPGMLGLGELEQTSWRLWDLIDSDPLDSDPLDSNIVKTFLLEC